MSSVCALVSSESDEEEDEEWAKVDAAMVDVRAPRGCCRPLVTASGCCHCCYICLFLLYLVAIPVWAKWLVASPMPAQYWHQDFPPFPYLDLKTQRNLALEHGGGHQVHMSQIPMHAGACNYACSSGGGGDMNFGVSITLNSSALITAQAHTVYPVMFASSDFKDWWVVADRRNSHPMPFWTSLASHYGHAYTHVTDACTRPLLITKATEQFMGSYILACIIWDPSALNAMEQATSLTDTDLGTICSAVGGVCGWSCGSNLEPSRLAGCDAHGNIEVTAQSVANRRIPSAQFQGRVELNQCGLGDRFGECQTNSEPYSNWQCHKCQYDPTGGTENFGGGFGIPGSGDQGPIIYRSLPRFQVKASRIELPEGVAMLGTPSVYVLTASSEAPSVWKKLYKENDPKIPPPSPVDEAGQSLTPAPEEEESEDAQAASQPHEAGAAKHAMSLADPNRVDMQPEWCFGERGPLYLVACAVNGSIYDEDFKDFLPGQRVAPPPFNDRCLAVGGRCGQACEPEQSAMPNCTVDGYINHTTLVGPAIPMTNESGSVWALVVVMLVAFSVKAATLCPGIFRPYPHYDRYEPELTESLRYIVVCIPSLAENKCIVLRNLVGAIGCIPTDCRCRYHVAFVDEGHRGEQKIMWQKLCQVISAIQNLGGRSSQENLRQFFSMWVEETKKLDLTKLRHESSAAVAPDILERMSGTTALGKLKRELGWSGIKPSMMAPLEAALRELEADLKETAQQLFQGGVLARDDLADWEPNERNSLPLRMHYLARAAPEEDERTVKAQHVAPGTWFYRIPGTAVLDKGQWLTWRSKAERLAYALEDEDAAGTHRVPLRTSRGKAGGLNFAVNYLSVYAERPDNKYGDMRDLAPSLFSICDARHQFQPDFFHSTLPFFFDEEAELDEAVAFTQCPVYFHEVHDQLDYMDHNKSQFFKLSCMIGNCCGGVSPSGTNTTWIIRPRETAGIWEQRKARVRNRRTNAKALDWVEHRTFNENCILAEGASSIEPILLGKRSQYVSRRLSYGMAPGPEEHYAALQRQTAGRVVLSLQTFFSCGRGVCSLWLTALFSATFFLSLLQLVTTTPDTRIAVRLGLISHDSFVNVSELLIFIFERAARAVDGLFFDHIFVRHPGALKVYTNMFIMTTLWLGLWAVLLLALSVFTALMKICRRGLGLNIFPSEIRWWGRLLICMQNLTHFLWFWIAFFWIGFNYSQIVGGTECHFPPLGMCMFVVLIQLLRVALVVTSSLRYTLETSSESNEVLSLTLDNVWRSTQVFYVTAPLTLWAIVAGVTDYCRYRLYGLDITMPAEGRSHAKAVVKYWTLLLICGAVAAWVIYAQGRYSGSGPFFSCVVVTMIALDVLHPCAYLWLGEPSAGKRQEAYDKLTWVQVLGSGSWWKQRVAALVLNPAAAGAIRCLGPALFVATPFLTLVMPYVGLNQAFLMQITTH